MRKREAKIYEIRKDQKTAKITKLRKMRHIIQDDIQLEIIYLNVRGINNKIKQKKIQEMLQQDGERGNKVIALVETKLNSDFHIQGFKSLQTSHYSKGGCMIASNVDRH